MSALSLDLSSTARVVKNEMICRNWKWRIMFVCAGILVVYFIFVIICGNFNLSNCFWCIPSIYHCTNPILWVPHIHVIGYRRVRIESIIKSKTIALLIERQEFRWILPHVLPVAATQLRSQRASPSASLIHRRVPAPWQSPLLRSHHLFPAEVCGHWIHSSLIHVVLIYLHWVPVVEVILWPSPCEAQHVSLCNVGRQITELFSGVMVYLLAVSVRDVSLPAEGSRAAYGWLAVHVWWFLGIVCDFFLEILVLFGELEDLNIFLIVALVGLL